ncbi:MAG: type 4a pilus biogenesis protein PilO [Methylotenera sp.]|nr:type 4a pilus biogenesis protein PilO [Methylotenera sp.]OQW68548.1 MAG: pilus assembly protein PilO [Proteobacteria bacterium ST_bin12]PPD18948.1 MAG: pilus assembly protein PilO [Methylotenera sp.]PPD56524.1 MAG: pilus assembly protein PilO [Methylotenera sp.]
MKLDDFNNIDIKNAGSLPMPVKLVLLGFICVILIGLGYWFLWSPQIDEFDQAEAKEQELRQLFLIKKGQAVKIDAYKQQMIDIEKTFGALLKQLPDKSQMDGLLTDINQAGLGRGLEFELFKPGQETTADFYAEMPIQIKIKGSYHDVGAFATDISKLSRIVTLNDMAISPLNKDTKDSPLILEAVAKTYRYLDSSELAAKKASEVKEVKK